MKKQKIMLRFSTIVGGVIVVVGVLAGMGMGGFKAIEDSAASVKLTNQFSETSLTVYPTFVRRVQGPIYDRKSAKQIAKCFTDVGMASVAVSDQQLPIVGKRIMIQWKLFKQTLELFSSYLKDNSLKTNYAVIAEYLITPLPDGGQAAGGIHCYVLDSDGRVAIAILLNTHHKIFAEAKPKTVEDCTAVLIKALKERLPAKKPLESNVAMQAFELRMAGKVDKAVELLEKAVAEDPGNGPAQFELARDYFCTTTDCVERTEGTLKQKQKAMKKQLTSAQKAIKRAIKANPDNPRYHYWAGRISTYNVVYDAHFVWTMPAVPIHSINAIKNYEKAVKLKPDFYQARHELIGLYDRLPWYCGGNKSKAREHAKKLNQTEPESGDDDLLVAPSEQMKARIGIYDSRAVALAYWRTENRLNAYHDSLTDRISEAETQENEKLTEELDAELWGHRKLLHKQVFGNKSIDDILAKIEDELAEVAEDANVDVLVSKWDKKTLKRYKYAELIDVTDLITAQFKPDEKILKTIEQLKKKKPIPLWQLDIMMKLENH